MLRLGISKQDRVFGLTQADLTQAGYNVPTFGRTEEFDLPQEGVRFIAVKDIDQVAFMIENSELDGLLLGADIAFEAQARIESTLALSSELDLEQARCRIAPIVMPDSLGKIEYLLSKYPGLSRQFLDKPEVAEFLTANQKKIQVRSFGSGAEVQARRSAKQNQMATDIVETGHTVRQNGGLIIDEARDAQLFGFRPLPTLMQSSLQLFSVGDLDNQTSQTMSCLRQRLEFVLNGRKYIMIKYNVPTGQLESVLRLTPERKNPTLTTAGGNMTAVEVMVENARVADLMVQLRESGASSILTYKPQLLSIT